MAPGYPFRSNTSAMILLHATDVSESDSDGFQMCVLPHTKLSAAFQKSTAHGKLNAVTMPT